MLDQLQVIGLLVLLIVSTAGSFYWGILRGRKIISFSNLKEGRYSVVGSVQVHPLGRQDYYVFADGKGGAYMVDFRESPAHPMFQAGDICIVGQDAHSKKTFCIDSWSFEMEI
jgi:hypothetical protein